MKPLKLLGICFVVIFLVTCGGVLSAAQGSYHYNIEGEAVPGPVAHRAVRLVFGDDLGVGELKNPQDLFVDRDNLIYIVDSGNNRIVCVDDRWQMVRIIDSFENDGKKDGFKNPTGIHVDKHGIIYVADQDNRRVVILDRNGTFIREITGPNESDIVPPDFTFRPRKLVVDRAGRIYVIAAGVLDGLMEFTEEGIFSGFIGAPRVSPSVLDYLWQRFMTKEQKERSQLFLPTEYSGFDIDSRGFIYATVAGDSTDVSQTIKCLNPAGDDVLRRNGFFPPMGDVDFIPEEAALDVSLTGRSRLVDIVVREYGIYSAVDQKRGRVFTYDDNGHLLYVFGGVGAKRGSFLAPVAIDTLGSRLLVLDSKTNSISVMEPSEYVQAIHEAIRYYQTGNYDKSTEMWEQVLRLNPNLDLAYSGIGRALLRQGQFHEAMETYRLANDRQGYSKALRLYRRQYISERFPAIMTTLVVLVLGIVLIRFLMRRKQSGSEEGYRGLAIKRSDNPFLEYLNGLKYALYVSLHPFDGFWDLKHEKRGSVASGTTILGLVVFTYILIRQYTGFIFNYHDPTRLNVYMELFSILVPFFLWCGVNLGLTSLMEGKGSFKDIYIATAYGLTPVILINLPLILLSNVITVEEGAFYYVLRTFAVIWSGLLIFFGTQVTHQYDLRKNFFTSVATGVGMGVVLFIALLFLNVLAQVYGFVDAVYTEIAFRM